MTEIIVGWSLLMIAMCIAWWLFHRPLKDDIDDQMKDGEINYEEDQDG